MHSVASPSMGGMNWASSSTRGDSSPRLFRLSATVAARVPSSSWRWIRRSKARLGDGLHALLELAGLQQDSAQVEVSFRESGDP